MGRKFGEIAVDEGYITPEQLDEALERQKEDKQLLGQILINLGLLTTAQIDNITQIQILEMAR